jgi:formylglycine-generating enzyme required for sulfatase activity
MVSWSEAAEFCRRLSEIAEEKDAGRRYRLPTEAEWEYACRAGSTGRWNVDIPDNVLSLAGEAKLLQDYAWTEQNSGGKSHPVAQKLPNPWGLYDMHGNVMQWCQDFAIIDYYENSPKDDPVGPPAGRLRSCRGGSWFQSTPCSRAAFRFCHLGTSFRHDLGFRVCIEKFDVPSPKN